MRLINFCYLCWDCIAAFIYCGVSVGVVNITYDATNKRALVVVKSSEQGKDKFRVLTFATDQTQGFVKAQPQTGSCLPAAQDSVWDMPVDIVRGAFKQFNFHRLSKTYIVADERVVNGVSKTVIQGFAEDGQKRFEAYVGPDISNLAINNTEGIIYVADNHSSAAGKIKTINISTGEVGIWCSPMGPVLWVLIQICVWIIVISYFMLATM